MAGWENICPQCDSRWWREGGTRNNYRRLADWTIECAECGNIENIKYNF